MALNRIVLLGRLTRDPELRHTHGGTAVASFSLAVDRDIKDRDTGERKTDFIDCVAWKGGAEFVSRYFTKGQQVVVEGRLQVRDWTDNDGNKRRSTEVHVNSVYFADSKRQSSDEGNRPYMGGGRRANDSEMAKMGQFAEIEDDDGNLPF